jgi:exodeoxyribonuclease VII large subunit
LEALGGTIDALSPLKVLSRGYSLNYKVATGEIVRRASDVRVGERIETRLADGRLTSIVDGVKD